MPTRGQPLAEGTYTVTRDDTQVGRETWQLTKKAHGGLLFSSTAERTQAQPIHWDLTYEVTQHWTPEALSIHFRSDGQEQASEQHFEGTRYIAMTRPAGSPEADQVVRILELNARQPVEFPSPIFTAVTLVRLNLQVGQTQPIDAVEVTAPTLEPRMRKLVYTCLNEEKIQVPAGSFSAWHYVRKESNDEGKTEGAPASDTEAQPVSIETHFWADRHGIVLLEQRPDGDVVRLARYRRTERR